MPNETQSTELPKDIFQRTALAELMGELICTVPSEDISPVVLHGPWGSGKSVHARRIQKYIQEKHAGTHKCIYWNAAQSDFAEDPLPLFLAALYTEIEEEHKKEFSSISFKLCCSAAWSVTKTLSNQLIKKATCVDCGELADAATNAKTDDDNNELINNFAAFLEEAAHDKKRIQTASKLLELAQGEKELIIIIDELDRCKPTFALKMLETIKHLFAKECCTFILVMNKEALTYAVQNTYGLPEEHAAIYLNKYIKQDFQIPDKLTLFEEEHDCAFLYFLDKIDFKKSIKAPYASKFIKKFIHLTRPQLREIDKWVFLFNILHKTQRVPKQILENDYSVITLFIATYIATVRSELLTKFLSKSIDFTAAAEELGITKELVHEDDMFNVNTGFIRGMLFNQLATPSQEAGRSFLMRGYSDKISQQCESCARQFDKWLRISAFFKY